MPFKPNASSLPNMADVFKSHPRPEALHDLLAASRLRAIIVLQEVIPSKIQYVRTLVESENDPSSPFYAGHVDEGAYVNPILLQPTDPTLGAKGIKAIKPDDIARGKRLAVSDKEDHEEDADTEGVEKGVIAGPHWFEVLECNDHLRELIKLSWKECEDLQLAVRDLRVWLELEIPLIEDGNSFGADVQGHLIKELGSAHTRSGDILNFCRLHHPDRARLAAAWVKFPNLMDYPAAIAASDRNEHLVLRSFLRALLQIYGGLLTKFERNWSKVTTPKGSGGGGGDAMY